MVDCGVYEMPKIGPPVFPYRGFRGIDPYGAGGFGAPRDSGTRTHVGLDFLALPADTGIAPHDGRIVRLGIAKPGSDLGSIHIQGTGPCHLYYTRLFYIKPDHGLELEQQVKMGECLGTVQNMAAWYMRAFPKPEGQEMKNHVHMAVRVDFDPARLLVELPCLP